jgi:hypothetical protein
MDSLLIIVSILNFIGPAHPTMHNTRSSNQPIHSYAQQFLYSAIFLCNTDDRAWRVLSEPGGILHFR